MNQDIKTSFNQLVEFVEPARPEVIRRAAFRDAGERRGALLRRQFRDHCVQRVDLAQNVILEGLVEHRQGTLNGVPYRVRFRRGTFRRNDARRLRRGGRFFLRFLGPLAGRIGTDAGFKFLLILVPNAPVNQKSLYPGNIAFRRRGYDNGRFPARPPLCSDHFFREPRETHYRHCLTRRDRHVLRRHVLAPVSL